MDIGALLREWRHRRKLSQLDLAIQADVSTRHLSFVETGRTVPSRDMVLRLAAHLDVPLRDRNRLLVAAGYAPVYQHRPVADLGLLDRVLRAHDPFPALVVDRRWNLVLANDAADVFLDGVDQELLRPPVNMMRLGLHPNGFASRVRNLAQVRGFLLPRLARSGDPELTALYDELRAYGPTTDDPSDDIALPIRIDYRGTELCFYNTITTFGAAFDITLDELAVETYLPADAATTRFLTDRQAARPS